MKFMLLEMKIDNVNLAFIFPFPLDCGTFAQVLVEARY